MAIFLVWTSGGGGVKWKKGLTYLHSTPQKKNTHTHSTATIILLEIYSEHCPACHLLRPTLAQAAQHFQCVLCSRARPLNAQQRD